MERKTFSLPPIESDESPSASQKDLDIVSLLEEVPDGASDTFPSVSTEALDAQDTEEQQPFLPIPLHVETFLHTLDLSREHFDRAGMALPQEALERLLQQSILGQSLHVLTSVSLPRMLMLAMMLHKEDLRVQRFRKKRPHLTTELAADSPLIENEYNKVPVDRSDLESAVLPLFTSGAVLLDSPRLLKRTLAILAFQETTSVFVSSVWGAFFSSLLVNSLVNMFLYPNDYESINKVQYLLTLSSTITDSLKTSLNQPYIWGPLIGVPLCIGAAYAIRAAVLVQTFEPHQLQPTLRYLKNYRTSWWNDVGGWVVNTMIPDILPMAACFAVLPQSIVQRTLVQTQQRIVWDGRLSAHDRLELFKELLKFSRKHHRLTQMNAFATLARLAQQIRWYDLKLLKQADLDTDNLMALISIKTQAFQELLRLATHYQLEEAPEHRLKPLPRYLYTNYLLWTLGYPQHLELQPLFFAYKGFKLYLTVMFYYALITGLQKIYNLYQEEQACLTQGKQWLWTPALGQYICSVCGDLPIFYRDIFTVENCFQGYLAQPRTLEDWQHFFQRFDLSNVTSIDLSTQLPTIFMNLLVTERFLNQLKPKVPNLKAFYLKSDKRRGYPDYSKVLAKFINNSLISTFNFTSFLYIPAFKIVQALTLILPSSSLTHLSLTSLTLNISFPEAQAFAQALQYSHVMALDISSVIIDSKLILSLTDIMTQAIAPILPLSSLEILNLANYRGAGNPPEGISFKTCLLLARKLTHSQIRYLNLNDHYLNATCIEALASALSHLSNKDFTLFLRTWDFDVGDELLHAFSKLLIQPNVSLTTLNLILGEKVTQEGLLTFFQALPQSPLKNLYLDGAGLQEPTPFNYSVLIPAWAEAIYRSNITAFRWGGGIQRGKNTGLYPTDAELLASFLPTHLSQLTELDLSQNAIGNLGFRALAQALNKTHIHLLNLAQNNITQGLDALAAVLPTAMLSQLGLSNNPIDDISGVEQFAIQLKKSRIKRIDFGYVSFSYLDPRNLNIIQENALTLIKELSGSPVQTLYLSQSNISDTTAKKIAQALSTVKKEPPPLWIDQINFGKQKTLFYDLPKTNLTTLEIRSYLRMNDTLIGINPGIDGIQALCDVLPQTLLDYNTFISQFAGISNIDEATLFNCGIVSEIVSQSNALRPSWPWVMLARTSQGLISLLTDSSSFLFALLRQQIRVTPRPSSLQSSTSLMDTSIPFATSRPEPTPFLLDASDYKGDDLILLNLDATLLFQSSLGNQPLAFLKKNTVTYKANTHSPHILLGGQKTTFDMTLNQAAMVVNPGYDNILHFSEHGTSHVVVTPQQGTLTLHGWNPPSTLHVFEPQILYPYPQAIPCQDIVSENASSVAVLSLENTTVYVHETSCPTLTQYMTLNDQEALHHAFEQVFDTLSPESTLSYSHLLAVCETFMQSMSQSALFTALPLLVNELLTHYGDHTPTEASAFAQHFQADLLVSMTASPASLTASTLAHWLATQVTPSSPYLSLIRLGVSLTTTALETTLTHNVHFGWMLLQTGAALLGTVVGSYGIQKMAQWSEKSLQTVQKTASLGSLWGSFWTKAPSKVSKIPLLPLVKNKTI